jgi:hypothetical protein
VVDPEDVHAAYRVESLALLARIREVRKLAAFSLETFGKVPDGYDEAEMVALEAAVLATCPAIGHDDRPQ